VKNKYYEILHYVLVIISVQFLNLLLSRNVLPVRCSQTTEFVTKQVFNLKNRDTCDSRFIVIFMMVSWQCKMVTIWCTSGGVKNVRWRGKRLPAPNYWLMQTVLIRNLHVQTETLRRGTIKLGPVVVSVFTQLDSSKLRSKKGGGTPPLPPFETSGPSHYASVINKLGVIYISQNRKELCCTIVYIVRNEEF
jgi:hypothetical protein